MANEIETLQMENEINPNNDLFLTYDENNYFRISFDALFGNNVLNVYNDFDLTSKRNFKNLASDILETYNELLLEDGKLREDAEVILLAILSAQAKIMTGECGQPSEFLKIIDNICDIGDSTLMRIVDSFVESNYALTLNSTTQEDINNKRNVNKELFISDEHAKIYLKISYLSRILIPIISQYFIYNKAAFPSKKDSKYEASVIDEDVCEDEDENELIFDEVNGAIFAHIFNKVAGSKEKANALRRKLYKLTISRVNRTQFSALRYWRVAKNLGITPDTVSLDIYNKLLTNSITKLKCDPELDLVKFFYVVVKNQVDFLFQNKFKNNYQIIDDLNEKFTTDDDDFSEYDKIEIRASRKNEGEAILQRLAIEETLKKLPVILNIPITFEEIRDTERYVHKNVIQEKILNMFLSKYFNDTATIKHLNSQQYSTALLCCKKFLENHAFSILPQLIMSKCEKQRDRVGITGTKITQKIKETKKYRDLFDTKYPNFQEEITKPLESIIGTIYCSTFKDADGNDLYDGANIKVGNIAEELVDLAWLI